MADCLTKNPNISDDNRRPNAFVSIIFPCGKTLLWLPVSITCLPFFLVGLLVWGLPPTILVWSRIFTYFKAAFTEGKLEDNIPFTNRVIICVLILNVAVKIATS